MLHIPVVICMAIYFTTLWPSPNNYNGCIVHWLTPPPSPNYNHGCIFHCTFQPPPQTITQSVHSTPFIHSFSDIEPWLYMPSHLPTPWFDLLLNYKLYRLKELLRTKLIECGWHDQLKDYCKGRCLMFYCILLGDLKRKNLTGQQIQNLFLSRD